METLTLTAPAKLNLTLDVLGKREDGYHEMRMVMTSVSLADEVTLTLEPGRAQSSLWIWAFCQWMEEIWRPLRRSAFDRLPVETGGG